MKKKAKIWVVCMGGEDWWYHSHAHFDIQIMKRFSKRLSVLYICSIGMRMPSIRKDKQFWLRIKRKINSILRGLKKVSPQLYVYSPVPLPLYRSRFGRFLNALILRIQIHAVYLYLGIKNPLLWINTPTAWAAMEKDGKRGLVYQRTDDYAAYDFDNFDAQYVAKVDMKLLQRADLVIHVSEELHREAKEITRCSLLLPQGVDEMFFRFNGSTPEDLKFIPRPILGYVGSMDTHKFNSQLIFQVARNLSECSFVMVGTPHPSTDELRKLPNVYFLGYKNHEAIPGYIHNFDICILPTAQTEWGLKCRPIKLMEYLAAKKDVIATPTPASKIFKDRIHIAEDFTSWIDLILHLTSLNNSGIKQYPDVEITTWDSIFSIIFNQLEEKKLVSY